MIIIISRGKGIEKYKNQFPKHRSIIIFGFRIFIIYSSDIDGNPNP